MTKFVGHFPDEQKIKVKYQGQIYNIYAFDKKSFFLSKDTQPHDKIYIFSNDCQGKLVYFKDLTLV